MASDDEEAFPSAKKMKIGTTTSNDTVQALNALFPKIDNLEFFPEKVLFQMFSMVNDADLLHLSDTSCRFEKIAKIVFKDKYTSKYFVFDGDTDAEREMYEELFSRFGRYADINAIKVNGIRKINENWLTQLLRQYTNHLQKITFEDCLIENIGDILFQHMNIEHLKLRYVHGARYDITDILPSYRNLKELELNGGSYTFANLVETIQNNPELESLILKRCNELTFYKMMMQIAENTKHLKELHLRCLKEDDTPISLDAINSIVNTLKRLESLNLTVCDSQLELIQQIGLKCKKLKSLALESHHHDNLSNAIIDAIQRFDTIEYLRLTQGRYDDRIESVVQYLPNLRQLHLSMQTPSSGTFILSLLRKCTSIETITIHINEFEEPTFFMNLKFFDKFNEIMCNPNGKVEYKDRGRIIGYVTKQEIVWRNKLLHWIGYDPSHNTSNLNLLDLAKPVNGLEAAETEHRSPFNHILDYLDLGSLYSMSTVNKQSKKLVDSYVKRHAQQNGTFTLSDELHEANTNGSHGMDTFAEHVENLKIYIYHSHFLDRQGTVAERYKKLNKLSIRSYTFFTFISFHSFSQVRHLILELIIEDLCDIFRFCPKLESLEAKNGLWFHNCCFENSLTFGTLKKFTFKCDDECELKQIRELFKNATTELIQLQ